LDSWRRRLPERKHRTSPNRRQRRRKRLLAVARRSADSFRKRGRADLDPVLADRGLFLGQPEREIDEHPRFRSVAAERFDVGWRDHLAAKCGSRSGPTEDARLRTEHRKLTRLAVEDPERLLRQRWIQREAPRPRPVQSDHVSRPDAEAIEKRDRLGIRGPPSDKIQPRREVLVDRRHATTETILRGGEVLIEGLVHAVLLLQSFEERIRPRVLGGGPCGGIDRRVRQHLVELEALAESRLHGGVLREGYPADEPR
jgi:hypothetical protein